MAATTVLPGGFHASDEYAREARLRPLSGEDQWFLVEECGRMPPAQWATEALARCVTRLGKAQPVTHEALRALTVGDREALLLQLRVLTWGDRLRCLLVCPAPGCAEKLEIDLDIAELLLPPYEQPAEEHEMVFRQEQDTAIIIRFRLPTGSDQEAAAAMARTDLAGAAELILKRCIRSVAAADGQAVDPLPEAIVNQLAERMAKLDPQAEIGLQLACPVCASTFNTIFDTASYLMQELQAGMRHIYREIHLLAYHYHWSATEILGMSTGRRQNFLRLLREELLQEALS